MEKLSYDKLLAPPYDIKLISQARRNPITYSRHTDAMDAVKISELHHRGDKSVFCGLGWCEVDN